MSTKLEAAARPLHSVETIKYWADAYSNPASGEHFQGHGMVVALLREYASLREALAEQAEQAAEPATSPTTGMNMAQRILHVGGRNNAAGYLEFGSIQAVEALVRQVLRDLPTQQPLTNLEGLKLAYNHHWINNLSLRDAFIQGIRDAEAAHNITSPATIAAPQLEAAQALIDQQAAEPNAVLVEGFGRVAMRKLNDLHEKGYAINGVSIATISEAGETNRGAVTTGGMVLWWPAQQAAEPSDEDIERILAQTLDKVAKHYGFMHAIDVQADITRNTYLRNAFARAVLNAAPTQQPLTAADVRRAGGIVHSDGNVFFTNLDMLNKAIAGSQAPTQQPLTEPWEMFPGYLIDKYEGETLTEELLQQAMAELLRQIAHGITGSKT